MLVLAAIFAVPIKGGRRDALPYVHAGWIAALALGGCTWLAASYVIALSGSTREVTEGITALRSRRDPALRWLLDARSGLCRPLADLSPGPAPRCPVRPHDVGTSAGVISRRIPRGVRDRALLSSLVDTSCTSVRSRAWWLVCRCRGAHRTRVADLHGALSASRSGLFLALLRSSWPCWP